MINPVLLIAIPLLAAFISVFIQKLSWVLLFGVSIFTAISGFFLQKGTFMIGGWKPPFGINLMIDDYSFIIIIVINLLFFLTLLSGMWELKKNKTILMVILAGINGLVMTGDLFNLFVFLEIITISGYILAASSDKYYSVFKYLVLGTLGSSLYLFGIMVLYGTLGTLNMADISQQFPNVSGSVKIISLTFVFAGLGVEAKLLPFNAWVKGIYGNTTPLTGPLFSTVFATGAIAVFGRIFGQILVPDSTLIFAFIALGLITFIFAETSAMASKKLRELLTFSSIGQAGLIITMFMIGGFYAALIQLINNAFAKTILFSYATKAYKSNGDDTINNMSGLFRKNVMMGFGFTVATLSLIGLPLFFGFYAKINMLQSAFALNMWIPALIILGSIIEGIYYIRLLVKLWNPGEEGQESSELAQSQFVIKNGFSLSLIAVLIGIIFVVSGIIPDFLTENIAKAADSLSDAATYLSTVLGGI
jgi:multicomponent Na+:H+ antiporter subunit D